MTPIAVTGSKRHPLLPDVPTVAEQGLKGYDFQFWNGLFAPARTGKAQVRELYKAVRAALDTPEVRDRFAQLGLVIVGSTSEEFAEVVKTDVEKFRKIIIESGIPRL